MQFVETPTRSFIAGGAISQYLRVKLSAGKLALAGATDYELGTARVDAFADGDPVAVHLRTAPGTVIMVAAGAIAVGADVYGAASGKANDVATSTYVYIGTALTAATGDGSLFEVLRAASNTAAA